MGLNSLFCDDFSVVNRRTVKDNTKNGGESRVIEDVITCMSRDFGGHGCAVCFVMVSCGRERVGDAVECDWTSLANLLYSIYNNRKSLCPSQEQKLFNSDITVATLPAE